MPFIIWRVLVFVLSVPWLGEVTVSGKEMVDRCTNGKSCKFETKILGDNTSNHRRNDWWCIFSSFASNFLARYLHCGLPITGIIKCGLTPFIEVETVSLQLSVEPTISEKRVSVCASYGFSYFAWFLAFIWFDIFDLSKGSSPGGMNSFLVYNLRVCDGGLSTLWFVFLFEFSLFLSLTRVPIDLHSSDYERFLKHIAFNDEPNVDFGDLSYLLLEVSILIVFLLPHKRVFFSGFILPVVDDNGVFSILIMWWPLVNIMMLIVWKEKGRCENEE